MTGVIAAAQYAVFSGGGGAPTSVQLHNQEIDAQATNATATAVYVVANDGSVSSSAGILETWLIGAAPASNYEVMASPSSGLAPSGTLGSWLSCGTSNTWSLSNGSKNNSVRGLVFTVQIRDVATHTVQASASITLSAESDNRFG